MDRVEVKDVRVPEQLMRAMAAEAEAAREARAKVIAAEGEHKSSKALMNAAQNIVRCPVALQVTRTIYLGRLPCNTNIDIVKLHSELALPTEPQLDRVGVDFVSPCHNK